MSDIKESENNTEEHKPIEVPYPYPHPLFEWFPSDIEHIKYNGDPTDINNRMAHKIATLWMVWSGIRNDERLRDIVNVKCDEESDEYYIKMQVVMIIDRIAKILTTTDFMEELRTTRYKNKID